ncbi:hypothetical protein PtA15_16A112 [Puccinia triticina]|uniref:Uncharacterized protein n=1 Tax=Puccinia triticina TaxID=208348 RepID=A0ABY7D471_9BASI|nr:uncharacterized protein PtA15_16A112 [Puccinia triticina]WAQ92206.1 hypothetical protein PtA15_16A112 [Puccinia triticina]
MMPLNVDELLCGGVDDQQSNFGGAHQDPTSPDHSHDSNSSDKFHPTDPNNIFDLPPNRGDVNMAGPMALNSFDDNIKEVCAELQSELKLDQDHLKIANIACKVYVSEAPDAAVIFFNGAYHQLAVSKNVGLAQRTTYTCDTTFKDFVRETAQLILLKPTIDAYSNNPHSNGTIPNSLFFLMLDTLDRQPNKWKQEHIPPPDVMETLQGLANYRRLIADLLKYRQSYLCDMLLLNTQETKKIKVNGPIPNRKDLLTKVDIQESPTKRTQANKGQDYATRTIHNGWTLMTDCAFYAVHHMHSKNIIVLNKDFELFSHNRYYKQMDKAEFTVPTIEEVQASVDTGIVPAILH